MALHNTRKFSPTIDPTWIEKTLALETDHIFQPRAHSNIELISVKRALASMSTLLQL
jgi:hypothetical protein